MAELKTQRNSGDVEAFVAGIADEGRREDCRRVMTILAALTGEEPALWGTSIIGYGQRHATYASGREIDWMLVGVSPRKDSLTLYLPVYLEFVAEQLAKIGRHRAGKGCLYIKRLSDIDIPALEELLRISLANAFRGIETS